MSIDSLSASAKTLARALSLAVPIQYINKKMAEHTRQ